MTNPAGTSYNRWTNSDLIKRVYELEAQLQSHNLISTTTRTGSLLPPQEEQPSKRPRLKRIFDSSKYNTRYIALKIAYLGQNYNGFEHHANNVTPLPTVEQELWKAFAKARLIFPNKGTDGAIDWEGLDYSKCGRTDKGVSAFGQVIGLRVRSNKPLRESKDVLLDSDNPSSADVPKNKWDPIHDEIEYSRTLNRLLPEDIRVLAWCPSAPEGFSARFSCRERQYRYFFTQPSFIPRPGIVGLRNGIEREGWLDIEAMREAAKLFEGLHDFRNFCKIDASKQITNFERRIFRAEIEEAHSCRGVPNFTKLLQFAPSQEQGVKETTVYSITITGTAFLWHQIRHIAAILFVVGQGLENPSLVADMLDIEKVAGKPHYEMADDAPLVLWDCIFPDENGDPHEDALEWIYPDMQAHQYHSQSFADGRYGPGGTNEVIWAEWRRRKIDEVLAGSLLDVIARQPMHELLDHNSTGLKANARDLSNLKQSQKIFDGSDRPKLKGDYTPILQRKRMETVDHQNLHYATRRGLDPATISQRIRPDEMDE